REGRMSASRRIRSSRPDDDGTLDSRRPQASGRGSVRRTDGRTSMMGGRRRRRGLATWALRAVCIAAALFVGRAAGADVAPDAWDPTDDTPAGATKIENPVGDSYVYSRGHTIGGTDAEDWFEF